MIAVLCTKCQSDWTMEKVVMDKRDFRDLSLRSVSPVAAKIYLDTLDDKFHPRVCSEPDQSALLSLKHTKCGPVESFPLGSLAPA